MDNNTKHTREMNQARGQLMRLERDLSQVKRNLDGATRKSLFGGIILLISVLGLIGFLLNGNSFLAVLATAGVIVGGLVFIKALMNRRGASNSINSVTDNVTNARTKLEELENQSD